MEALVSLVPLSLLLLMSVPAWAEDSDTKAPETPASPGNAILNDQYVTAAAAGKDGLFGKLADRDFARIALAVDPAWVREQVGTAQQPASVAVQTEAAPQPREWVQPPGGGTPDSAETVLAALTGTSIEQQIAVLLAGLARFTADRAKQESLGWGLDTIGTAVCVTRDGTQDADLLDEINQQMLRSFCTLARGKRLSGYGAGEGTWQAVRSAVDSDLRDLPGVVAGRLVVEALRTGDLPDTRATAAKVSAARQAAEAAQADALKFCKRAGATCTAGASRTAPALPAEAEATANHAAQAAKDAAALVPKVGTSETGTLAQRLAAASAATTRESADAVAVVDRLNGAAADVKTARDAAATAKAAAAAIDAAKRKAKDRANAASTAASQAVEEAESAWSALSGDSMTALSAHASRAADLHDAMVAAQAADAKGKAEAATATTAKAAVKEANNALVKARSTNEATKAAAAKAPGDAALKDAAAAAAAALKKAEDEYQTKLGAAAAARASAAGAGADAADAADAAMGDFDAANLRDAFRTAFRRVVDGADPVQGLMDLGTGISAAASGDNEASKALRLAACAVSLPGATSAALTSLGEASVTPTSITLALTSAPACRDVVAMPDPAPAGAETSEAVEQALQVYREVAPFATAYASQWRSLQTAVEAIQKDAGAFTTSSQDLVTFLGRDDLSSKQVDEVSAMVEAQVRAGQAVLLKSLDVFDAAVGMARTTTEAISRLDVAADYAYEVDAASSLLGDIASVSGLVRSVVSGDVGGALTTATPYLEKLCKDQDPKCVERAHEIAGYAGGVAAIAAAKTPDDAAKAIAGVANPPGGWAAKVGKGRVTVGITDFAGLVGGVEFRRGPNGLVYEDGGVYAASPTLSLPLSAEVTVGTRVGYWSFYNSILDPAAFLQYDPSAGGALPPAKVTTALALGAGVRWAPAKSPFGLGLSYTWRPGLRTASTDPFGPGADAHQICLGLNADLSLIHLYTLEPKGK